MKKELPINDRGIVASGFGEAGDMWNKLANESMNGIQASEYRENADECYRLYWLLTRCD